jgi:hypothetical protein
MTSIASTLKHSFVACLCNCFPAIDGVCERGRANLTRMGSLNRASDRRVYPRSQTSGAPGNEDIRTSRHVPSESILVHNCSATYGRMMQRSMLDSVKLPLNRCRNLTIPFPRFFCGRLRFRGCLSAQKASYRLEVCRCSR